MEMSILTNLSFKIHECISCGIKFGIPIDYDNRLRNTRIIFYCPNGHPQHYAGETEAEKLRKELRRKDQELANQAISNIELQNELDKVNRKLKRVHNGTCPCCKRSFANLKKHIQSKHPELINK